MFSKLHYDGLATITEWTKVRDPDTGLIKENEVTLVESQPCHLSLEASPAGSQSASAAAITPSAKLFIDPGLMIKPGSKVTVTQAGVTAVYTHSGKAAIYDTHQEITLELSERYA
jgi:hypothetical protein